MSTRGWCAVLLCLLAGCNDCGGSDGTTDDESDAGQQAGQSLQQGACSVSVATVLAAAQDGFSGDSNDVDTRRLLPNGPMATIALASGYDATDPADTVGMIARIVANEAIPYPRFNLKASDTVYVWVEDCPGQNQVFFVAPDSSVGNRTPAWVGHPHTGGGTKNVLLRDTTVTTSRDSLRVVFGLDSAYIADSLPADTSAAGAVTAQLTKVCARCTLGWCNAL